MQHVYAVGYTVVYRAKHGKAWKRFSFDGDVNVVANGDAAKAVSKAKQIVLGQRGWKNDETGEQFRPVSFRMTGVEQRQEINCPTE